MDKFFIFYCFFFNDTATTEIYTLSLHDALPISQYREIGFDSFEEYNCADDHFSFELNGNSSIDNQNSHTGRKSIRITPGNSVELTKYLEECPQ